MIDYHIYSAKGKGLRPKDTIELDIVLDKAENYVLSYCRFRDGSYKFRMSDYGEAYLKDLVSFVKWRGSNL